MSTAGPHKTAIQRWALSRPVALALELQPTSSTSATSSTSLRIRRSAPSFSARLGDLAQTLLIVSARLEWEARTVAGDFQGDGIVTRKRTFQKFFAQDELRDWIQSVVGRSCVAAAPGVYYIFRDPADEQSFVAGRLTRPRRVPTVQFSEEVFEQRQDILKPVMDFVSQRGRLPVDVELDVAPRIKEVFGSIARAFSLIRRVTGPDQWETIRRERRDDLLVYLALAAFGKRPKLRSLPDTLRYDIRAFFGTYKAACAEADGLLFSAGDQEAINRACGQAPVGKILPGALYIHRTAIARLPTLLRIYEGCGRQLVGAVEGDDAHKARSAPPAGLISCVSGL